MEQLLGTYPYRFEVTDPDRARVIEFRRKGIVGQWSRRTGRSTRWVTCRIEEIPEGTVVHMAASRGLGPVRRALQLVDLLTKGSHDARTVYRDRRIPPGPVSLVASWAGMPYQLYTEPSWAASRGAQIFTATRLEAIPGGAGRFVKVRLADGTDGYVEEDQVVAAPEPATREAQLDAARFV